MVVVVVVVVVVVAAMMIEQTNRGSRSSVTSPRPSSTQNLYVTRGAQPGDTHVPYVLLPRLDKVDGHQALFRHPGNIYRCKWE
ncbi:hypothetical protein E2C01_094869 [Portunus trituberculatus]|uniref:Uncharacterized protein n=1 Tax=Portunus trituberculatus TaxID=210409 RepID=A0A5B7JY19_PORTR|nr:hypothetical protein [Portunus trituberculatus]